MLVASGCAGGPAARAGLDPEDMAALDGARFVWVEASCVDGALPLAQLGFERELFTAVRSNRLQMTFDTHLARDRCDALLIWDALPDPEGAYWDFVAAARVVSPVDAVCGVGDMGKYGGQVEAIPDGLAVVSFRSPWCRGFDARFTYRRVVPRKLTEQELLRRYVGHYNRRDLPALAALFSAQATLLEPFSRTADGTIKRHEGREAVVAWFQLAFASSSWSALRLQEIYPAGDDRTWVVSWDYMDSELAAPVPGRNLFVLADGEIFLTEVQLTDVPTPRSASEPDGGLGTEAPASEVPVSGAQP